MSTINQMITEFAKINNMSEADLAAFMAKAEAAQPVKALSCKVSEKGALSVYGLGRFPVTLYRGQWERLFAAREGSA